MSTPKTPDRASIIAQVTAIATLTRDEMKDEWRRLFGTEPPGYGPDLMRRRLQYRVQELAYGGIAEETRKRLREIDRLAQEKAKHPEEADRPIAGTMFVREHGGERHEVIVLQVGYQYRGERYDSLSAIAKKITGGHWNGWRFFGIRRNTKRIAS
jgi:hypothetical protein